MGTHIWVGLTLAIVLRGAVPAVASEPAESLWHSDNRVFNLRVTPGGDGRPAHGVLYGDRATDAGAEIWSRELLNAVAPGEVLVADSGRFVVTFDEWDAAGTGDNVVVIYGPDGRTTGRFSLDELFGPGEAEALKLNLSAGGWEGWYRRAMIIGDTLSIDTLAQYRPPPDPFRFRTVRISLAEGKVIEYR